MNTAVDNFSGDRGEHPDNIAEYNDSSKLPYAARSHEEHLAEHAREAQHRPSPRSTDLLVRRSTGAYLRRGGDDDSRHQRGGRSVRPSVEHPPGIEDEDKWRQRYDAHRQRTREFIAHHGQTRAGAGVRHRSTSCSSSCSSSSCSTSCSSSSYSSSSSSSSYSSSSSSPSQAPRGRRAARYAPLSEARGGRSETARDVHSEGAGAFRPQSEPQPQQGEAAREPSRQQPPREQQEEPHQQLQSKAKEPQQPQQHPQKPQQSQPSQQPKPKPQPQQPQKPQQQQQQQPGKMKAGGGGAAAAGAKGGAPAKKKMERSHSSSSWTSTSTTDNEGERGTTQRLKRALQGDYDVDSYDPHYPLGAGWKARTHDNKHVFIRSFNAPHGDVGHLRRVDHPTIVSCREVRELTGLGTVFIFDAVDHGTTTLRAMVDNKDEPLKEDEVGNLFTPIVLGLRQLESELALPHGALIDANTVLAYPQVMTARVMNPLQMVHGAHDDEHKHRRLLKDVRKIERKQAKADGKQKGKRHESHRDDVLERTKERGSTPPHMPLLKHDVQIRDEGLLHQLDDVLARMLTADLGMILYELMTKKHTYKISSKMISDAKRMHKRARKGKRDAIYSPELTGLLVDLLRNGKKAKDPVIPLRQLAGHPALKKFVSSSGTRRVESEHLGSAQQHPSSKKGGDKKMIPTQKPSGDDTKQHSGTGKRT